MRITPVISVTGMRNTYVIVNNKMQLYQSHLIGYLSTSDGYIVNYAANYKAARRYRFRWWATHRAKVLTSNSNWYFYVYRKVGEVRGVWIFELVDKTINDDMMKARQLTCQKIEMIVDEWRRRKKITE